MEGEVEKVVAALDQGTTSTRCLLVNHGGEVVASHQIEHAQIYPKPGWVEHDPGEIWQKTQSVVRLALEKAGATAADVAAVGITNQRETTVVWDRNTGEPLHPAIVWQDMRTDKICRQLAEEGGQDRFRAQTGLPLATYFSGPKIRWLLDEVDGLRQAAERGDALFGNMDTWLIWNLTGGPDGGAHVTDVTNASRTQLMNLETLHWDPELLSIMEIPEAMLPEIRPSSDPSHYGLTRADGPFAGVVPVCGDLGDQQAALYGQTCFAPGEAKNTYGTGCFLLLNTGEENRCLALGTLDDGGISDRRERAHLRARRLRRHRGGSRSVASRQPSAHLERAGGRGSRPRREGQRWDVSRAGFFRPLRTALAE